MERNILHARSQHDQTARMTSKDREQSWLGHQVAVNQMQHRTSASFSYISIYYTHTYHHQSLDSKGNYLTINAYLMANFPGYLE